MKANRSFMLAGVLFLLLVDGLLVVTFQEEYRWHERELVAKQTQLLKVQLAAVVQGLKGTADLVSAELLQGEGILGRVAALVAMKDGQGKNAARKELYQVLLPLYRRLMRSGVKQLHFQEPDTRSLLRMHRPELFGDPLGEIRSTVREANLRLEPRYGFEEGRIFNGFRNVYPLLYQGRHVGSVEVSFSSSWVLRQMNELYPGTFGFILDARMVRGTVFNSEQDNYMPSDLGKDFVVESNAWVEMFAAESREKTARVKGIHARLVAQPGFSLLPWREAWFRVNYLDTVYMVIALPLLNYDGHETGYILSYHEAPELRNQDHVLAVQVAGVVAFSLVVLGFLIVLERKNRRLVAQKAELAEALESRTRFFSRMSHELRTPLNAIIGFTGLLSREPGHPRQQEYLGLVESASKSLLMLINDILDLSKYRQVGVKLRPAVLGTRQFFSQVVGMFGPKAGEKGLDLQLELGGEVPAEVVVDGLRLKQILYNLLSNALKFTDKGFVRLEVDVSRTAAEAGGGGMGGTDGGKMAREAGGAAATAGGTGGGGSGLVLEIRVRDSGVGIDRADFEGVFADYGQSSRHDEQRHGGTGLGLAIVREICQAMGARVRLESLPGHGTTFALSIPVGLAGTAGGGNGAGDGEVAAGMQEGLAMYWPRVLVVDDNPLNILFLRELVAPLAGEVFEAHDGKAAVEVQEQLVCDLVLMDVQMPSLDGFEACAAIRARERASGRPGAVVVGVSASVEGDDRDRGLEVGMDAFVSKPVDHDELLGVLGALWRPGARAPVPGSGPPAMSDPGRHTGPEPGPEAVPPPPLDMLRLDMFAAMRDRGKARILLEKALIELEERNLPVLKELCSVGFRDTPEFRKTMHRLKGGLSYLGCRDLVAVLACLETVRPAVDGCQDPAMEQLPVLVRRLGDDLARMRQFGPEAYLRYT